MCEQRLVIVAFLLATPGRDFSRQCAACDSTIALTAKRMYSLLLQHRSFIVRVQSHDTVARVRAQLLHILYELGHEDHQFRLRFKGQYLRDAYTIEDYAIVENAIIKMVPHSRSEEVD